MKKSYSFKVSPSGHIRLVKDDTYIAIYTLNYPGHPFWIDGFWLNPTWAENTWLSTDLVEIAKFYHDNRDTIIEDCKKFMIKEML